MYLSQPATRTHSQFDFIIDLNLHRRHLDESQRAMVAARVATLRKGSNQHTTENAPIGASTQDEAADRFNVARRSVQRARIVIDTATPEVVKLVEDGKLAVSAAASA